MTLLAGTDTGASQLLGAIQATPVSSTGLESRETGTQGLGEGPLVGSNCSTTCKILRGEEFYHGETGTRDDKRRTRARAPHGNGSWLQEAHKNGFCTTSPSGSAGRQQSKRRESNQSHDSIVPPPIAMTLSHPGALCREYRRDRRPCAASWTRPSPSKPSPTLPGGGGGGQGQG